MAEPLQARSALSEMLVPGHGGAAAGGPAGVTVREQEVSGCVQLAARKGNARGVAEAMCAAGLDLPEQPGWREGGGLSAVWLGPERWLVFGPDGLEDRLRARLGDIASISGQSDSRALLRLSGPHVRDALAKGVPVDLHPGVFPAGAAAVTQVAHVGVVLWRPGEASEFCLAVARSYAGTLAEWLIASAAEYGLAVE